MTDEELLDFAGDLDLLDPEGPPVSADDLDQADRWLRGMRAVMRRRDAFLAVANRRRAELDARVEEVLYPMEARIAELEEALEKFHAAVLARDKFATTVKLPSGELTSRAGGVEWVVEDEAALRAWLKDNMPALLVAQEPPEARLARAEMKVAFAGAVTEQKKGGQVPTLEDGKVVAETGEVVPGLRVIAKPRKYVPKVG